MIINHAVSIVLLIVAHIVLPIILLSWLLIIRSANLISFTLKILIIMMYIVFILRETPSMKYIMIRCTLPLTVLQLRLSMNYPIISPFSGQYPNDVGNRVRIKTEKCYLFMCHFKKGSIVVKEGDQVSKGQLIGKVGNSGWSDQPHLHIQAMKLTNTGEVGEGKPLYFEGKKSGQKQYIFK